MSTIIACWYYMQTCMQEVFGLRPCRGTSYIFVFCICTSMYWYVLGLSSYILVKFFNWRYERRVWIDDILLIPMFVWGWIKKAEFLRIVTSCMYMFVLENSIFQHSHTIAFYILSMYYDVHVTTENILVCTLNWKTLQVCTKINQVHTGTYWGTYWYISKNYV